MNGISAFRGSFSCKKNKKMSRKALNIPPTIKKTRHPAAAPRDIILRRQHRQPPPADQHYPFKIK
jgi:hypothetical protein